MRALDRLALYTTCAATAVMLSAMVLIYQQSQLRSGTGTTEAGREHPVVQPVDWVRLAPELRRGVETARTEGLKNARAELERLHTEIMTRVDSNFLDWYFGYWTQQRLGASYAYTSGKNWVLSSFIEVDPEEARENLQSEIAREFQLRVVPGAILDERLQQIAQESVAVFVSSLQRDLQAIPKQYQIPATQWDNYLDRIALMVSGTAGTRDVPLSLKALSAGGVLTGASATAALALYVTAQFTHGMAAAGPGPASAVLTRSVGRRAGATLARHATARGLAAGAGTWGSTLTGGLTLAALIAWEVWDHQSTVAENRPLLRNNIDHFLGLYEASLVEPRGMIGSILHGLEGQIATSIPR